MLAAVLRATLHLAGSGLSLCLYARSGSGKSEWARRLAQRMGRKVIANCASDMWDCCLGDSEKNVAEAFRQAEDEDALLLFDEVDCFLRDRFVVRATTPQNDSTAGGTRSSLRPPSRRVGF